MTSIGLGARAAGFVLVGILLLAGNVAIAQEGEDKVIATVNGVEITERELALAESDLQQQFAQAPEGEQQPELLLVSALQPFLKQS